MAVGAGPQHRARSPAGTKKPTSAGKNGARKPSKVTGGKSVSSTRASGAPRSSSSSSSSSSSNPDVPCRVSSGRLPNGYYTTHDNAARTRALWKYFGDRKESVRLVTSAEGVSSSKYTS